jgi:alkylated DNA repair dioxygenase AlkB
VVLTRDGAVRYEPHLLDPEQADDLLRALLARTAWSQDAFTLYGRRVPFPRLTAWYGDPGAVYTYSGIRNEPLPWTVPLEGLRGLLAARTGPAPTIASVSVGAERVFEFEHRGDRERIALVLGHGSLLLMEGETQRRWRHRLPKRRAAAGVRVNLTFRVIT